MSNKIPWFTHDHDARNDEFLQRAEDQFGHFGYAAYFKILEIIHQHGVGGVLVMNKSRVCLNLRSRWPQVQLYLDFCRTSGKVEFNLSGDEVRLQNKKFIERQSKMKSNLLSTFREPSVNLPLEEKEIEIEKKRLSPMAKVEKVKKTRIPQPVDLVMRGFKVAKTVDPDDKVWDDIHYKRFIKPAHTILKVFQGNAKLAMEYVILKGDEFDQKNLSWQLETIAKHSATDPRVLELIQGKGEEHGSESSAVDAVGMDGRGRSFGVASSRDLAGGALAGIGKQAALSNDGTCDLARPGQDRFDDEPFEP